MEAPPPRRFGVGKGDVFPASEAATLERPVRRLVQSPASTARWIRLMPDHRVLELGCGPGYFSLELSRRLPRGLLVVADLQAEMLAMTRAKFEASARRSVSPIRLDARVLPFRAGAFDVVFLSAVLGETGDPVASVDEITRVVAPGGRLVVAETLGDPDRISLKLLRSWLEPRSWTLTRHRTRFWSYTAEFVAQTAK